MLYHCINAKRLAMKPTPPLPIHAERYPRGTSISILLDMGDGATTSTESFFGVSPVRGGTTEAKAVRHRQIPVANTTKMNLPLEPLTQALFDELAKRRAALAEISKVPAWRILSDKILVLLARERPYDTTTLLSVKGIGKLQQKKYGDQWLEVIAQFRTMNGFESFLDAPATVTTNTSAEQAASTSAKGSVPQTPHRPQTRRNVSLDSSPAFDTPPPRTPQLPRGVSLPMAGTSLAADADDDISSLGSDESLPSLNFGSPLRAAKRRRIESPKNHRTCKHIMSLSLSQKPPMTSAVEELSAEYRITRNKLLAFSKLVTRKLPSRPMDAPPIVSDLVLDLIVRRRPRSQHDLERIPGIDGFLLACEQSGTDLLRNVIKFTSPGE